MSDKSNKYGYVGVDIPAQSFGANKGVFNPAEINELVADNKWTQFGQLELIETQTASGTSTLEFKDLPTNYNVLFFTYDDVRASVDGATLHIRLSNDNGSSFISSSNYDFAHQEGRASGSFFEIKSTTSTNVRLNGNAGNQSNEKENGYIYFYNLFDSTKYSFLNYHNSNYNRDPSATFNFGSAVLHIAETHNAIQFYSSGGGNLDSGTVSLYGIKEYS